MSTDRSPVQSVGSRIRTWLSTLMGWATFGPTEQSTLSESHSVSYFSAFKARSSTYLATATLYMTLFLFTSGAPGTRSSLWSWLWSGPPAASLARYLLTAIAVTGAASLLAQLLTATPASGRRWFDLGVWPYVAGAAFTLGSSTQMRLTNNPSDAAGPALTLLGGALLLAPLTLRGLRALPARHIAAIRLGWAIAGIAIALRFLAPLLLPSGDLGRGEIFGRNVGEIGRVLIIVATALVLTGASRQAIAHVQGQVGWRYLTRSLIARLWPILLYLAGLFMVDLGPALLLIFVIGALVLATYPTRAFRRSFWAFLTVAGAAMVLGLTLRSFLPDQFVVTEALNRVADRFTDGGCGQGVLTQACKSQRILHNVGMLPDLDPVGSPMTGKLEAANSDYAPTVVGSVVGVMALLLLFAGVIAIGARLIAAAKFSRSDTDDAALRARLALGAGTAVLVASSYLGLAILLPRLADVSASFPLTGLDVPLLAANGSSSLQYGFLVAVAVMGLRQNASSSETYSGGTAGLTAGRWLSRVAGTVCVLLVIGAMWIRWAPAGSWSAGADRLATESLLRDTSGMILTSDGAVFSEPGGETEDSNTSPDMRIYPHPAWAVDLGFLRSHPSLNLAVGIEYLAAPLLTCGQHRSGSLLDGLLAECKSRDVVATINGELQDRVQELAAARAEDGYLPETTADIVIVERGTGAIKTIASSASQSADMQAIVTGGDPAWRPRSLPPDAEPTPKAIRLYALALLNPVEAVCLEPDPPNPKNPNDTRANCEADQDSLGIMHPFRYSAPPGSAFKPIPALAAQLASTGLPPGSLGSSLTDVKGVPIEPPLYNRAGLGPCPEETIGAMLKYSCNTTAGWFGVAAGPESITRAARDTGFLAGDGSRPGGAVYGPADPSSPDQSPFPMYYKTSELGLSAGGVDPSTLSRTSIGQAGVRSGLLDLVSVAAAVADRSVPRLKLIAGTCTPRGKFDADSGSVGAPTPLPESTSRLLDPIASGMRAATEPGGTAAQLPPSVEMAKTGTADDGVNYQRWVMGATDNYIFAARVGPIQEGRTRDTNPALLLASQAISEVQRMQLKLSSQSDQEPLGGEPSNPIDQPATACD